MNRMKRKQNRSYLKILLLNNTITVKNSVEIFNSRLDQTEKWICELEARSFEILQSEQEKEKEKKKKKNEKEGEKKLMWTVGYL